MLSKEMTYLGKQSYFTDIKAYNIKKHKQHVVKVLFIPRGE